MSTIKRMLAQIMDDQKEIKESLSPSTIRKANERDELVKRLSEFGTIPVKSVSVLDSPNGGKMVKVEYSIAPEYVLIDIDESVSCTDHFSSMNALDIVSPSDQKKISEAIENAQKQ